MIWQEQIIRALVDLGLIELPVVVLGFEVRKELVGVGGEKITISVEFRKIVELKK